jgi:hypothetical protein
VHLPQEPPFMPFRLRLTLALPLALFMAAAVARAELGADTEASVLFTPSFGPALAVAAVLALLVAPGFGRGDLAGWLRSGGLAALVLASAGLVAGGIDGHPMGLLSALPAHPFAWGAAVLGLVVPQVLALRKGQDQSRK